VELIKGFKGVDANGDERVTLWELTRNEELSANHNKMYESGDIMIESLDTSEDGWLSRDEVSAII